MTSEQNTSFARATGRPLLKIAPRKRIQSGVIYSGAALVTFDDFPLCLMLQGDTIPLVFGEPPFRVSALCEVLIGPQVWEADEKDVLTRIARHSVRCRKLPALARAAHLLGELADKCDSDESETRLNLHLTQSEFAALLGISTVHMCRTLRSLDATGATQHGKGYVLIKNRWVLDEVAKAAEQPSKNVQF